MVWLIARQQCPARCIHGWSDVEGKASQMVDFQVAKAPMQGSLRRLMPPDEHEEKLDPRN